MASAAPPSAVGLIHRGTGALVGPAAARDAAAERAGGEDGDVTLNFVETDIREVLRSVLGDVLHVSYAVEPKVQATVTVQTGRPLRRQDVLPMLQQVLRASGLVLVEVGGVYRVVPLEEGPRAASVPVSVNPGLAQPPPAGASVTVQVLPLKYAAAADLVRTIEPFLPKGALLEADAVRNVLVLSGTGQDLTTVLDLVRTFDVDWLSGMSYSIVPLQSGSAKAIVQELGQVFGPGGSLPLAGIVRFAPLERMNAVLVVSPQRAYLDQARGWIERFDTGDNETRPQLYQYHVQNSRAADLAKVLSQLLGAGAVHTVQPLTAPGTTPLELGSPPAPGGPENRLGGGISAPPPAPPLAAAGGLPGAAGAPSAPGNAPPPPSQRSETADQPPAGGSEEGAAPPTVGFEIPQARIVADERNNALVIFAKPAIYRMIEETLKKLDIVPLQVLIEATIAEVTLTHDLQFGLQWLFKPGKGTVDFTTNAAGTIASIFPGFNAVLGTTRANTVLSALKSITDVNVISSPQLLVLDHNVATLQVGDQVPILTAQVQSTITNGAPVVNAIDYRDTGVILRVSPRVNSNGLITLDIAQEVSDVTKTTSSGIDAPTFNRRRIESTITVQDGETIALGGLIKDNKTFTRNGVPLLSDIPVVGSLFRADDDNKVRTELLILLSPRVLRNSAEARAMTDELRRRLIGLRPLVDQIR